MRPWPALIACVGLVFATVSGTRAQSPGKESAPIPTQILTAKRVFISNTGADALAVSAFKRLGDINLPYARFYSEMKSWGKYELVSTPAEASLVFEIHFGAPISNCDKLTSYAPEFELSILDTQSHFVLWRLSAPVDGAVRKSTFAKNLDQGMSALMTDLKSLASQSASAVASAKP